jgi:hypothetical protein
MELKWGYHAAMTAAAGQFAAVMEGGLKLISYGALAYVAGVYWESDKKAAKDIGEEIMRLCQTSGYRRGAQYDYADLSLKIARALVKAFGQGIGKDVNAFWVTIQAEEAVDAAVAHVLTWIKVDLGVNTVRDLREALSGEKKPKAEKSFADKIKALVTRSLEAGEIGQDDLTAAAMAIIAEMDAATANKLVTTVADLLVKAADAEAAANRLQPGGQSLAA